MHPSSRVQTAISAFNELNRNKRCTEIGRDALEFEEECNGLLRRLHSDVALVLEIDYMLRTIGSGKTGDIVRHKALQFGSLLSGILMDQLIITVGRLFDESPKAISFSTAMTFVKRNRKQLLTDRSADPLAAKDFDQHLAHMRKHAAKLQQPRNKYIAHNDRRTHQDRNHTGFPIGNLAEHNTFLEQLTQGIVRLAACLGVRTTEPVAIRVEGDIETVVIALAQLADDHDWPFSDLHCTTE